MKNIQKAPKNISRHVKRHVKNFDFNKVLRIEDTPERIALSFGIGVFIGFLPLLWFHILLIIPIIVLFRVNKFAIILGTFIIHPFSLYLMTPTSFKLGTRVLGNPDLVLSFSTIHLAYWPLFVGSVTFGIISAAVAYVAVYYGIIIYRKKKEEKAKKLKKQNNG